MFTDSLFLKYFFHYYSVCPLPHSIILGFFLYFTFRVVFSSIQSISIFLILYWFLFHSVNFLFSTSFLIRSYSWSICLFVSFSSFFLPFSFSFVVFLFHLGARALKDVRGQSNLSTLANPLPNRLLL